MLDNGSPVPFYEYKRQDGTTFEIMQKMVDPPLECDPETGLPVTRVFHPIAVHFKGKGFYNTDYGTKKRAREKDAHDSSKKQSETSDASGGDSKGESKSRVLAAKSESSSSSSSSSDSSLEFEHAEHQARQGLRLSPARKRRTFACLTASGTRPETVPRISASGVPATDSAPKSPISVGPLMSERSALGTFQEISGSRANAIGDSSRRFIAPTIFCWRRARVRSSSFELQSFLRVRASASACLPSMCDLPARQAQRVAAVLEAAVDPRDDAAAAVRDAAHRVDERREVLEAHDHHVVDVDRQCKLSIVCTASAVPPIA